MNTQHSEQQTQDEAQAAQVAEEAQGAQAASQEESEDAGAGMGEAGEERDALPEDEEYTEEPDPEEVAAAQADERGEVEEEDFDDEEDDLDEEERETRKEEDAEDEAMRLEAEAQAAVKVPRAPSTRVMDGAVIVKLPLAEVVLLSEGEAGANYRSRYDEQKLQELTESIEARGVLEPIAVRRDGGGFPIIFGSRRVLAARRAGLSEIPGVVLEVTAQEAEELMLEENLHREDPHPLDEAEGYARFQRGPKALTVEEVAARVGKRPAHIAQRLSLLALAPEVREAFLSGQLLLDGAEQFATVPHADLQVRCLKDLLRSGDPHSPKEVRNVISRTRVLLKNAPFPVGDGSLVADAPACGACKKRTGAQAFLFADAGSKDICTDNKCYTAKALASYERERTKALEAGQRALTVEESQKVFSRHRGDEVEYESGYLDLAVKCYQDDKQRPYAEVLGPCGLPVTLAMDRNGFPHRLVNRKDAEKALKEVLGQQRRERESTPKAQERKATQREENRKQRERQAEDRSVLALGFAAIREKAGKLGLSRALLLFLAKQLVDFHHFEDRKAILSRHTTPEERAEQKAKDKAKAEEKNHHFYRTDPGEVLWKKIQKLEDEQLLGVIVELSAAKFASPDPKSWGPNPFLEALDLVGVSIKDLRKQAKQEAKEKGKGKTAKGETAKKAGAKKKATAKKAAAKKKAGGARQGKGEAGRAAAP